jgi:shikimate dehydrogenase
MSREPVVVSAATRLAAVIGAPLAHSLSPALHNAAFAALGMDAVYLALPVAPEDLPAAVAGMGALGFIGASVTVPHKRAVAQLCDRLSPSAEQIGAVNCLVFEPGPTRPQVVGHNTDAGGFIDSLQRDARIDPAGCRTVLLGGGGVARAVYAGLRDARVDRIDVIARAPERVLWTVAQPWTPAVLQSVCAPCDLLVDCTSLALSPERERLAPAPIPVDALPDRALVVSLVYHREPALLTAARTRGLPVLDGAGMLVYQGARAFALWTGAEPPVAAMWSAMHAAAARR